MSRNRFSDTTRSGFVAFLLIAQAVLMAVSVGAAPPVHTVSSDQQSAIVQALGSGAPHGVWESRLEISEFFLHSDELVSTGDPLPLPDLPVPVPAPDATYSMDLRSSGQSADVGVDDITHNAIVIGSSSPGFDPLGLGIADLLHYQNVAFAAQEAPALDDVQIFEMGITLFVGGLPPESTLRIIVLERDAGNDVVDEWGTMIARHAGGQIPDTGFGLAAFPYSGEISFGSEGKTLKEGHYLEIIIGTDTESPLGAPAVLYLDTTTYPSRLTVQADSARVNVWTETIQNDVSNTFGPANLPNGGPASTPDRQVKVRVLHANAWGADQFDLPGRNANNLHRLELRDLDRQQNIEINAAFKDWPTVRTGPELLSNDGALRFYTYTLTYPAGFDDGDPITPDGLYRFEVRQTRQNWGQIYQSIIIGDRGFDFDLAPGEIATHTVLAGEPTVFALQLNNTSPTSDIVGLAVANSGGWQTSFGNSQISLGPNGQQLVFLTVTPPASAQAGSVRDLSLSAASLVSNEIKTLQVRVEVVTTLQKGVDLSVVKPVIETRPGLTDTSFIQLRNTGNAADRYVITHSGAPAGWGVTLTPPSMDLFAASRGDILLQITPPLDAQAGDGFTLVVSAVSAADSTVTDVLLIPVTIFEQRGLLISLIGDDERVLRNQGAAIAGLIDGLFFGDEATDTKFDRTTLNKIRIHNTGDVTETFAIEGFWNQAADYPSGKAPTDRTGCEGTSSSTRDGIPDGWRVQVDPRTGATGMPLLATDLASGNPPRGAFSVNSGSQASAFSGIYSLGAITLEPGKEFDYYFALGWLTGDRCGNGTPASNTGMFTVQVYSDDDGSLQAADSVFVERIAAGAIEGQNRYANAVNDVVLQLAPNVHATAGASLADEFTEYQVIARNDGNEPDRLRINLPPGANGWVNEITEWQEEFMFTPTGPYQDTFNGEGTNDPPESSMQAGCSRVNLRSINCYMGVKDEVTFTVRVSPPDGARFGDSQPTAIQVMSEADGNKFDALTLLTTVTAPFAFEATELKPDLDIVPGGTAAFPYTVKNLGQRPDNYVVRVLEGPTSWLPQVSATGQVFVPADLSHHGYLSVRAPSDATAGQTQFFRVEVESLGELTNPADNTRKVMDFFATVVAPGQLVLGAPPVVARQGETVEVTVTAEDLTSSSNHAIFRVNPLGLPVGWTVVAANPDGTASTSTEAIGEFGADARAQVKFLVTAPAQELSTSRIALRVNATSDAGLSGFTDAQLDLGSVFGLSIEKASAKELVVPGRTVEHVLNITNNGLTADTITLTSAPLPAGWGLNFDQVSFTLQPLEKRQVTAIVAAPAGLDPGTQSTILMFARSTGDVSKVAQTTLVTEVGLAKLEVTAPDAIQYLAPEETGTFVVSVRNNGTLHDQVLLTGELLPVFGTAAQFEPRTSTFTLAPGQGRDVLVDFTMPRLVSGGTNVPVNVIAQSSFAGIIGTDTLTAQILPYVAQDVDGDGIDEYAVSRDRNPDTGFEEFRESTLAGGIQTQVPDLQRFLTAEAIAAKTVNGTFEYFIDGDGDGRADFLLDTSADGLPNIYWDPDRRHVFRLDIQRDVTGDGVREYFIDVDGDGLLDVWFDLTTGVFGRLIQVDIDGDGTMDYIVDLNGNGVADPDEPVLYSRTGGLLTVRMVDITGDGRLDQVFDVDGDGNPDYFVPAGSTRSIPIVLQDVNGDGVADWTYDANGDGRRDSYYDPVTGQTGIIDSLSAFNRALVDHWYIGVLFLVVAVLFVTLLAVTRRR